MVKAIVGGNWGAEGKGRMTDFLAAQSDVVVRYQGGADAGHTIHNEFGTFTLSLLPSGVFYPHVLNVLGQGVAFDPAAFFDELRALTQAGVPRPKLMISSRAQVVLPHHPLLDRLTEERSRSDPFGGIPRDAAPFYSDACLKIGVQVCDLLEEGYLREKLRRIYEDTNLQLRAVYGSAEQIDPDVVALQLMDFGAGLQPMVGDVTLTLNRAIKSGKSILLEGQLGALKDLYNGVYPFTASSSTLAGAACVGAGIPPHAIEEIHAVVKAYSSLVGAGPFVSEIFGDEAETLRGQGESEQENVGGRPRRVGWFDVVASRYGCMLQGATQVAVSMLDVLGYLDKIPVCVAYEVDGEIVHDFPAAPALNRARPVMDYLPGWQTNIRGVRSWHDLPREAQDYVLYIEEKLGRPVTAISTGPRRQDIIFR